MRSWEELPAAFQRCQSEVGEVGALRKGVFFEELLESCRHIEVQILGDGTGSAIHLFERDCSVQLNRQKVIEVCPAISLDPKLRHELLIHSVVMAKACRFKGAGTFEYLVDEKKRYAFIECNPRIQVEHTVTEEATRIDLVQAQLLIAGGATLVSMGLSQDMVQLTSHAIQARVSMTRPGTVISYLEPGGIGVRIESSLFNGASPRTDFDPLLMKVIASAPSCSSLSSSSSFTAQCSGIELSKRRLLLACEQTIIRGIDTNLGLIRGVLASPAFIEGRYTTEMLGKELEQGKYTNGIGINTEDESFWKLTEVRTGQNGEVGKDKKLEEEREGCTWVRAPLSGEVSLIGAKVGDSVQADTVMAVILSMKMEHEVSCGMTGRVVACSRVKLGSQIEAGDGIYLVEQVDSEKSEACESEELDPLGVRDDLDEVLIRRVMTEDAWRLKNDPSFEKKIKRRHQMGLLTARESVSAVVDSGSFREIGRFLVAAQRGRREINDLIKHTQADGMVSGIGSVNRDLFGARASRTAVLAYDYTVLAGTQGFWNHHKADRMIQVARQEGIPVIWWCEGGGGRPGDVDLAHIAGGTLTTSSFYQFSTLSAQVPRIGIGSGNCFAGNAALLGSCDIVIGVAGCQIGMGGPAMIEGGGLGKFSAKDIGPFDVQTRNGVIDIAVETDVEAAVVAKKCLSYFQGAISSRGAAPAAEQKLLRGVVPENRKRVYEMRDLIRILTDEDSFTELRASWGLSLITGFARVEGRPLGIVASNPKHLGGAIDSDAALKAARFLELCDAFSIPVLHLCDCPGFMVGPQSEESSAVRKMSQLFTIGASLTVPFFSIVIRKAYGLGAMALTGGMHMGPSAFCVAWPSGEFGGMGLEGAVKLGFQKELEAAAKISPQQHEAVYDNLLSGAYEAGKALNNAMKLEIEDVIDPAESRALVLSQLEAHQPGSMPRLPTEKRRPCVSSW